ncbi:hypothetical protein E2C01_102296 [Portunus trituberculatus]|uniref:Uncharacterized protein n=1 Tax=Portunus trituberculatus TaxID=210409 RepID=A0A5B7K7T4_PORTR|nr:hypothetical protein [Portunus trituberculatus]
MFLARVLARPRRPSPAFPNWIDLGLRLPSTAASSIDSLKTKQEEQREGEREERKAREEGCVREKREGGLEGKLEE